MHACAALFKDVFALIRDEQNALEEEDMDRLEELAQQRADLVQKIWAKREGYDKNALIIGLRTVLDAHGKLNDAAEVLHAKYRAQQQNGRKQAKYFTTERNVYSQIQKSQYFNKIS